MKRAVCLLVIALTACQPQTAKPGSSAPPANGNMADRIYVQDPSGSRMLEMDWSGRVLGSVAAAGFAIPSADGSKFLRTGDQPSIEDWRGHIISPFDPGLSDYSLAVWADDNGHLCGVQYSPNGAAGSSKASVWILTPGQTPRVIASVDTAGSAPAVQACSVANNRVVIATGAFPHWPPGGTRYLITTEVTALNLSTGAVEYHHVYPQGNMGGQLEVGPPGNWMLVTASPDGRYLAETAVFSRVTEIRDLTTGRVITTLPGSVIGFSSDGTRVVDVITGAGLSETGVMTWVDQHLIWQTPGGSTGVLSRPRSSDLVIAVTNAAGSSDLYALTGRRAVAIARHVFMQGMCPCYPGA